MKKEKGIDDIFKHSLQDPVNEPDFAEHDWDALENMLDKKDKGGRIIGLPYLSAAAAVVLIAFCWWMFKPADTTVQNNQLVKNQPKKAAPVVDTASVQAPQVAVAPSTINKDNVVITQSQNPTDNKIAITPKSQPSPAYAAGSANMVKRNHETGVASAPGLIEPLGVNEDDDVKGNDYIIAATATPVINLTPAGAQQAPVLAAADILPPSAIRPLAVAKVDIKKPVSAAFRPQFSLAMIASPEINGVGTFQGSSRGTNLGMMFTIGVSKFTLTTGATYSLKPYSLPFSQYPSTYTFKTQPETVTADCRILDIPINIGYRVYNKSRNKLTLGTGVSSYIMMHESYTYDYGNASTVYGPSYYAVKGKGKYPFSVMNVQATYERQINSKFGLSLQPYYKIPLSEIGYSQVKVQTFGVAVGLNWNINSLTKPK